MMSDTCVLILASGRQSRWEQDRRFPVNHKQLLKLGDERIIERIIRQCRGRGVNPIVVTHHEDIMNAVRGAVCLPVRGRRWTVETLFNTSLHWRHRTIVLLGDVIYSRALMDRIFAYSGVTGVFGNEWEIYALSFISELEHANSARVIVALLDARHSAEKRESKGKLRQFYEAYCGLPLTSGEVEDSVMQYVDYKTDYTADVDTPKEFITFMNKIVRAGKLDDLE